MKLFCPKCKAKLGVDTDIEGSVECPSCAEVIDITALRTSTCPICGCAFEEMDEIRICPDCKVPHHVECWTENRGCSTYGCASAAHQETHTTETAGKGSDVNAGMVSCPACGAMHPASDLVCGACGKLLSGNLPGDSSAMRIRDLTRRTIAAVQKDVIPRLGRNFKLLGGDTVTVFRLWLGEFSKYGVFKGKTSRKAFVAFMGVNCAGYFLLFSSPLIRLGVVIALLLPSMAICVRRLRDTDISPWMVFAIPLQPFLFLVPSVKESDELQHKETMT